MFVRLLAAFLVLANLAFVGLYFDEIQQVIGFRSAQPLVAPEENLSIFLPPESTVQPSVSVTTNRIQAPSCVIIGNFFVEESAEAMRRWLQTRGISGRLDTRVTITQQTHRVYTGPFPDQDAALLAQRVVERKDPKIKAFVHQVENAWRTSFGQFESIEQAQAQKQHVENIVNNLRVFIDTRTKSQSTNSVRFFESQADKIEQLRASSDKDLMQRMETDNVTFMKCTN